MQKQCTVDLWTAGYAGSRLTASARSPMDKPWTTLCVAHRLPTGRRLPTSSTVLKPIVIKSGKVKTKTPAPALAYSSPVAVQTTGTTADHPRNLESFARCFTFLGGMLPDIDHPKSWLGSKIPVLPTLLYESTGHRGATHSLLVMLVLVAAIWVGCQAFAVNEVVSSLLVCGFLIGYGMHLLGDFFSNKGVPLLWPLPAKFGFSVCATASATERLITVGMVFLAGGVLAMQYLIATPSG